MELATVYTRAILGVEAPLVTIEVHISNGLPGLLIVGLPETTVKEAKDRVRSALINCGFTFPAKRITVNLAPADLPKEGARYDLPIAIAILAASEQIPIDNIHQYEFIGELGLSGEVRGVRGIISAALSIEKAKRVLITSQLNQNELALLDSDNILISGSLLDICQYILGQKKLPSPKKQGSNNSSADFLIDMDDIIGQEQAKRALEIAAAGGHNLLFIGPPSSGKTMLAMRLPTILPQLTRKEALESASIQSLALSSLSLNDWQKRPFRAPHHSASIAALVGGGSNPRPGEISLAHNGILFLDELPEFDRRVLDTLRQPLESGNICISRANHKVTFPAKFQLIAAMNPSPTGHYQGIHHRVSPQQIMKYLGRLSGPFLDRFDLSIEVPLPPKGTLTSNYRRGENSQTIKARINEARHLQLTQRKNLNSNLTTKEIEQYCHLNSDDALYLENALQTLNLSTRGWYRIIKVARTIADLEKVETISRKHLTEALSYRSMERMMINLHRLLT